MFKFLSVELAWAQNQSVVFFSSEKVWAYIQTKGSQHLGCRSLKPSVPHWCELRIVLSREAVMCWGTGQGVLAICYHRYWRLRSKSSSASKSAVKQVVWLRLWTDLPSSSFLDKCEDCSAKKLALSLGNLICASPEVTAKVAGERGWGERLCGLALAFCRKRQALMLCDAWMDMGWDFGMDLYLVTHVPVKTWDLFAHMFLVCKAAVGSWRWKRDNEKKILCWMAGCSINR